MLFYRNITFRFANLLVRPFGSQPCSCLGNYASYSSLRPRSLDCPCDIIVASTCIAVSKRDWLEADLPLRFGQDADCVLKGPPAVPALRILLEAPGALTQRTLFHQHSSCTPSRDSYTGTYHVPPRPRTRELKCGMPHPRTGRGEWSKGYY